jgi:uracil-DNA glycosylase
MKNQELAKRTAEITEKLRSLDIGHYIDKTSLVAPIPFRGSGKIKLIILAQDPTVRKLKHRQEIKVALLLDHIHEKGRLPKYLRNICQELGLDLNQNVYATNILKNFFVNRPNQLEKTEPGLIIRAFSFWKDLLYKELLEFRDIPVITLGEPVLNCFLKEPVQIQDYWGFIGPRDYTGKMKHILPGENSLHRHIFPFAHIHGLRHKLYRENLKRYAEYMKDYIKLFVN